MSGFRLARILGIDIHIHGSWLIIAGLVMWSLSAAALPSDFPELAGGARLIMAAAITLLFFLSLLGHELGHSVVAQARGIPVQRITFFLFGGMAQTSRESRSPGEEFAIAVAGPLTSFLLAGLFFSVWFLGDGAGWSPLVVGSAAYTAVLNVVLGVFNLLPGFPMDGGRVLRAAIWKTTGSVTRATLWASRIGAGMAWLLIGYGFWEMTRGDIMGGVWLVLIGWFIRHAARSSYRQHLVSRMQQVTQEVFESRYHRHPAGGRGVWPRSTGGLEGGRDVTGLGGNET